MVGVERRSWTIIVYWLWLLIDIFRRIVSDVLRLIVVMVVWRLIVVSRVWRTVDRVEEPKLSMTTFQDRT